MRMNPCSLSYQEAQEVRIVKHDREHRGTGKQKSGIKYSPRRHSKNASRRRRVHIIQAKECGKTILKKYEKPYNMYRDYEKVYFTKDKVCDRNDVVEGVIWVYKKHGPYPEVVREPVKGLTWTAWSYFYFRNIFMVSSWMIY